MEPVLAGQPHLEFTIAVSFNATPPPHSSSFCFFSFFLSLMSAIAGVTATTVSRRYISHLGTLSLAISGRGMESRGPQETIWEIHQVHTPKPSSGDGMKRPSLVGGCQGGSGQLILGREGAKRVTGSARSLARPMSWGQVLTPVPVFTLLSFTTSFTWMAEEGHVGELDGTSPCRSTTPQIHHRSLSFNATPSFSSFFLSLMSAILFAAL